MPLQQGDVKIQISLPIPPTAHASMTGWWVADAVSGGNGDAVGSWPDASGLGYTLSQSTAGFKPTLRKPSVNGHASVRFDGVDDILTTAAGVTLDEVFNNSGDGTVFVVARVLSLGTAAIRPLVASSNFQMVVVSGDHSRALAGKPTLVTMAEASEASSIGAKTNITDDQVAGWEVYCSDNVAGAVRNGARDLDTANLAAGGSSSLTLTDLWRVGSNSGSSWHGSNGYFAGEIAEVITYERVLTESERRKVQAYLCEKYKVGYGSTLEPTWSDLLDVDSDSGIEAVYGLGGNHPKDRVAETGTLAFTLINHEGNSQGKVGLYSPGHANQLSGFRLGAEVRLAITFEGATYYKWRGRINDIVPEAGKYGAKRVDVQCVDWMDEAAKAKLRGVAIQLNKRSDELFQTILANLASPPPATLVGYGMETYPYALDNARDEELSALTEFQKLANSELGLIYVRGDTAQGGTLVFEDRRNRGTSGTNVFDLTEGIITDLDSGQSRDGIINRVQVEVHPRRVDAAATTVLFSLANKPSILRGSSNKFSAPYRDPASGRTVRVGGLAMVNPVVTTDYTFNTLEDGTGTDLSAQLVVTATFGGNSADVEVKNNGPLDGFLTKMQLRGKGVYDFETVIIPAEDVTSKLTYGGNDVTFDMPYQNRTDVGLDAATYLLQRGKDPLTQVAGVEFVANYPNAGADPDDLMRAALQLEISSRIGLSESVTGLDQVTEPRGFFINSVRLVISRGVVVRVTWALSPANLESYWILEKSGFTELDDTTRLAYGLFEVGWILDTSTLGTDTYVNQ